jgi:hypothetical protein
MVAMRKHMHETDYSRLYLQRPAVILGLRLRTYSLAHELWLTARDNPLLRAHDTAADYSAALLEAAVICHHDAAGLRKMDRDLWIRWKLRLLNRRARKLTAQALALELGKFMAWRARGSTFPPLEEIPNHSRQPSPPSGAPFILRLEQFLIIRYRLTKDQALNHSFGLAQWHFAAWSESQGSLRIRNHIDEFTDRLTTEVDRRVAQGEDFQKAFVAVRAELEAAK